MFPGSARRHRRRQRRRRRRALVLATAIIVAVAAFAELRGHGQQRISTVPAQAPSPPGNSAPPAAGMLTTAGQGVAWADFHGIALPVSAQAGPHHTRGGLAWGFHDTPRGALLAAVNIGVRTAALWGPSIYAPTINRQVTGPGKGALLNADTSDYAALRAAAHVQAGAARRARLCGRDGLPVRHLESCPRGGGHRHRRPRHQRRNRARGHPHRGHLARR